MRPERFHLETRLETVPCDLGRDSRITRFDELGDVQPQLRVVINNQHSVGAARVPRDRSRPTAPHEFLDVTEKEAAVTTGRGQRPQETPCRPLAYGDWIDHQQLGNLVGCQMRLALGFLHEFYFPSLPDGVASRDPAP